MTEQSQPVVTGTGVLNRLDRLEEYLRHDANNVSLLAEAFFEAFTIEAWDRAEFHLRHALALEPESLVWLVREADLWMAQGRYKEAAKILQRLAGRGDLGPQAVDLVLHNLALIDFQLRDFDRCVQRLAVRMDALVHDGSLVVSSPFPETLALSKLWLRSLHHQGQLDRAVAWAQGLEDNGALHPAVAGVASLVAFDLEQFECARRWAARGLQSSDRVEPSSDLFITLASLALGTRDAAQAKLFGLEALKRNCFDGRSWSILGFCDLLAGDAAAASVNFEKALQGMPNHVGTWHGFGWAKLVQGELHAAQQAFQKALDLDRKFSETYGALAVVLLMQGNSGEASGHVQRSLRLDPQSASGQFAGALLRGEIDSAQAIEKLTERLLARYISN